MKIALISFYNSALERGAENWVTEISKRLADENEIKVFSNPDQRINKLKRKWLKRLFLDSQSLEVARFTSSILAHLYKGSYDIIIPINGGWQAVLIRLFTWMTGKKMMIVGHSGKGWDDRINLWTFPDVFVALTPTAQKWAADVNSLVKVQLIPNGVDLKRFSPQGPKISVDTNQPIILIVAALVSSKQIDLTIKAVNQLKEGFLLIVGKGELKKQLETHAQRLLPNRYKFMEVPFEQMPEVYRAADVFTLCSWHNESAPLVYLEALATNLPVVATDDSQRKDMLGEAGIYVDPFDTQAYTDALHHSLQRKWGDIPLQRAKNFSWEIIAEEYKQLVRRLKR